MNRVIYFLGFCVGIMAMMFAVVLLNKTWIRQSTSPASETVSFNVADLQRMFNLAGKQSPEWNKSFTEILENSLKAKISSTPIERNSASLHTERALNNTFQFIISDEKELTYSQVTVHFPASGFAGSLNKKYKIVALLSACIILIIVMFLLFILTSKKMGRPGHFASDHSSEIESFARLTKTSINQGVALELARAEGRRIQEELQFQQTLLNRVLEEKVRLSNNLHDHVIQSLYATGLALEAAKVFAPTDPSQAIHQLDVGMRALNCTIRDVRNYISGLGNDDKETNFKEYIISLIKERGLSEGVDFDLRIDNDVAGRLNNAQIAELIQIISEGISNSLRHGAASRIVIRLHEGNEQLCLLIQDNGKGFDINTLTEVGYGLKNMRARASRLGAQFRCVSAPNSGTRLIFTIPAVVAVEV